MHHIFDERRYLIPFRAALLPQIFTEVLVIGQGVAGQCAALTAAESGEVIVAAKGKLRGSNTYWAQGGIAAVLDPADSFESHIQDTLDAGADLCDPQAVKTVVEAAPLCIRELIDRGMQFDLAAAGGGSTLALGREGAHTNSRIVHADGDATGRVLATTLRRLVEGNDRIRLFENCFVLDLITVDGHSPRCIGAITHHPIYGLQVIWASATILASGGLGQVYRESTNAADATGDGFAVAYRAGAKLADMAFIQFHPTTLYVAGASRSLITEAVRGEGGLLVDRDGYRFMPDYHDQAELAPRDVVSRAILTQLRKTGHTQVYLDCSPITAPKFKERFPGISAVLKDFDIEPGADPIPIQPAAHYMIGGVLTDQFGRTNVEGLYACGEVACTRLHGANRLASNSLLEGLVFGQICGHCSLEMLESSQSRVPIKIVSAIPSSDRSELDISDVRSSLRSVMWRHVGIERDGDRLVEVAEMFDFWARYTLDKIFDDVDGWQAQNMLLVGAMITRAARWRCESRGTHYRLDYPVPTDEYRVHDVWQFGEVAPSTMTVDQPVNTEI